MADEDKELLLKDLCSRIMHGVKLLIYDEYIVDLVGVYDGRVIVKYSEGTMVLDSLDGVKPILRSSLDMTDEELTEAMSLHDMSKGDNKVYITVSKFMEFFTRGHFDYNGLIQKGLAHETKIGEIYKQ